MDPDLSVFGRAERTFWNVWDYITEAVERFLRREPIVIATDDDTKSVAIPAEDTADGETVRGGGGQDEGAGTSPGLTALPAVTWEPCSRDLGAHREEDVHFTLTSSRGGDSPGLDDHFEEGQGTGEDRDDDPTENEDCVSPATTALKTGTEEEPGDEERCLGGEELCPELGDVDRDTDQENHGAGETEGTYRRKNLEGEEGVCWVETEEPGQEEPHMLVEPGREEPHTLEGSGLEEPHTLEGSGLEEPHTLKEPGREEPHTLEGSGLEEPHTLEGSGLEEPHTLKEPGREEPHTLEGSGLEEPHTLKEPGREEPHTLEGSGLEEPHTLEGSGLEEPHMLEEPGGEAKEDVDEMRMNEEEEQEEEVMQDASEEDLSDGEEGPPDVCERKDEDEAINSCFREDGGSLAGLDEQNDPEMLLPCEDVSGDGGESEGSPVIFPSGLDDKLQMAFDNGCFVSNDEVTIVTEQQMKTGKTEREENREVEEHWIENVVEDECRVVEMKPGPYKKTEVIQTLHEEEEKDDDEEISSQMCDTTEKDATEDCKDHGCEDIQCVMENAVVEIEEGKPQVKELREEELGIAETVTKDAVSETEHAWAEEGGKEDSRVFQSVSRGVSIVPEAEEVQDEVTGLSTSCDQMRNLDLEKILERCLRKEEMEGALTSTTGAGAMENNRVEMSGELRGPGLSPGVRRGPCALQEPGGRKACEKKPEEVPEYNNGKELDGDMPQKILEAGGDGGTRTAQLQEVNTEVSSEMAESAECIRSCFESDLPSVSEGNTEHKSSEEGSHEQRNVDLVPEGRSETVSRTETKPLRDTQESDAFPVNRTEIQAAAGLAEARVGLSEEETPGTEAELPKDNELQREESGAAETLEGRDGTLNESVTEIVDMRTPSTAPVDPEDDLSREEPAMDESSAIEPEGECRVPQMLTGDELVQECMEGAEPAEEMVSGTVTLPQDTDHIETGLQIAEKDAGLQIEAEAGISDVRMETSVLATETEGTVDLEAKRTEETDGTLANRTEETDGTLAKRTDETDGMLAKRTGETEAESEEENTAEISDEDTRIALSNGGCSENVTPEGSAGIDRDIDCLAELQDVSEEKENGFWDKPPEDENAQRMTEAETAQRMTETETAQRMTEAETAQRMTEAETTQRMTEAGISTGSRLPEEMVTPHVPLPEHSNETEAELTQTLEESEDEETGEGDVRSLSDETPELRNKTAILEYEVKIGPGSTEDAYERSFMKSEEIESGQMEEVVETEPGSQKDTDIDWADVRGPTMLSVETNAEQFRDTVEIDIGLTSDIEAVLSRGPEVGSPDSASEEHLGTEAPVKITDAGLLVDIDETGENIPVLEETVESELPQEVVMTGVTSETVESDESSEDLTQRLGSGLRMESSDTSGLSKETDTDSADQSLEAGTKITAAELAEVSPEIETGFDETEIKVFDAVLVSEISQDTEEAGLSVKTDVGVPEVTGGMESGLLMVVKAESTCVPEEMEENVTESLEGEVSSSLVMDETVPLGERSEIEALSEEIGAELADEHCEVDAKSESSPSPRTSSADQDLQLQCQGSILDFKAQKSRIFVKNRRVRPPKDPRTLLHMPSLAPSPLKPSPHGLARGLPGLPVGGIGIKLPGLGGGFPVLRKTQVSARGEANTDNTSEVTWSTALTKSETEPEVEEESPKKEETKRKPKWTPPLHPGFGNPLMSELKNKLKKTAHE